jgi:uncharacterized protein (TIGR02453 family)
VFDSGHHPPVTRDIVADIRRLTGRPVRYLVVSHWHDDPWVGNGEFADAWPGLQVLAHPFTVHMMETRKDVFSGEPCRTGIDGETKGLRDRLAAGKEVDGTPLPEATRAPAGLHRGQRRVRRAECAGMRYHGVDRLVDSTLTLDLGGRTVQLVYRGRGNTAGDLVTWLPDARTVLTGDLVVHPFPFPTQSYITEWAQVLRRIDDMHPAVIVPGHGKVMHDTRYVERVAAVLESIASQAKAVYHPGMTARELRGRIDLGTFGEEFSQGDAFVRANFDYRMTGPAIHRMWQELSGEWKPRGRLSRRPVSSPVPWDLRVAHGGLVQEGRRHDGRLLEVVAAQGRPPGAREGLTNRDVGRLREGRPHGSARPALAGGPATPPIARSIIGPRRDAVAATPFFTKDTFRFLADLKAHNDRPWFAANKARYEDHVKVPALAFIEAFAPLLKKISPHFSAGPRSLFRIYRDTRFAKDKSPFKVHTGIQFRHDRGGDVHAPGFYFHIEPGACFTGLGLWHPDASALRRIRELIAEEAAAWKKATRGRGFTDALEMHGERLARPPKGFDPDHPMIEDLKWKDFIGGCSLTDAFVTSPDLPKALAKLFAAGTPLMKFLCKAVEVPF